MKKTLLVALLALAIGFFFTCTGTGWNIANNTLSFFGFNIYNFDPDIGLTDDNFPPSLPLTLDILTSSAAGLLVLSLNILTSLIVIYLIRRLI